MKKKIKLIVTGLVISAVLAILAYYGAFFRVDRWAADGLYQQPQPTSGRIMVVGIDEKALKELGPFQTWDRNVVANALDYLSSDPENMPSVVAIDTLYSGESGNAEADAHLAEAASKLPCVITADMAQFGTSGSFSEDGSYSVDKFSVVGFEEPYEALKNVTIQGHINAMNDTDGILRHGLLYVEHDGEKVYSMASQAAMEYAKQHDMDITLPKVGSIGQYTVTFYGMPGAYYEGISIVDLVNGDIDTSAFRDKIIYIGPYASGLQDNVYTPIAHGVQMYGTEFQANCTEMILDGSYLSEVSDRLQAIALFIFIFLLYLILRQTGILSSSIIAAATVGASAGSSYLLYQNGKLMHPLWVPISIGITYIITTLYRYLKALREKQRVQNTFQRYVSPEIVADILKEGTESLGLGGKLCDIAVLFVDVRGFTTMSERLDPETVVKILNRYLGMTSECIAKNKGTLDKFVGDATMAFWGAPLPDEDAVYHAVRTALDIVAGSEEVSKELKAEIGEELHVGVGVHFGPAVVGNIGAERHMDYTAIGDTVNTAARLEANAPGSTVYVSRAVADSLGERIVTTSLGDTIKLKGKAEGFEVLKVEELKP